MFLFLSWHYRSPYASAQRGSCLDENKGTRKQTKRGEAGILIGALYVRGPELDSKHMSTHADTHTHTHRK